MRPYNSTRQQQAVQAKRLSGQAKLTTKKESALGLIDALIVEGQKLLEKEKVEDEAEAFYVEVKKWRQNASTQMNTITDDKKFALAFSAPSGGLAKKDAEGYFRLAQDAIAKTRSSLDSCRSLVEYEEDGWVYLNPSTPEFLERKARRQT